MLSICLIAVCPIQEETARRCSAEPGSMWAVERQITFADTADLRRSRVQTVDHQACRRMADELVVPANHRIVSIQVERPR